jgi:hypothetical protein
MNKTLTIAAVIALAGLTACSGYNDERGKGDAPVANYSDNGWQVQNAPDGFGNVATICSAFVDGQRLWQVTGGTTPIVITRDETCKAGA